MEIKEFFKKMGEKLNCLRQAGFKYNFFWGLRPSQSKKFLGVFIAVWRKTKSFTGLHTPDCAPMKLVVRKDATKVTDMLVLFYLSIVSKRSDKCVLLFMTAGFLSRGCLTFNTSIRDESGLVSTFSLQVVHRAWKNSSRFWWKRNTSSSRQPPYNKWWISAHLHRCWSWNSYSPGID